MNECQLEVLEKKNYFPLASWVRADIPESVSRKTAELIMDFISEVPRRPPQWLCCNGVHGIESGLLFKNNYGVNDIIICGCALVSYERGEVGSRSFPQTIATDALLQDKLVEEPLSLWYDKDT